jgi:hypothetical protein
MSSSSLEPNEKNIDDAPEPVNALPPELAPLNALPVNALPPDAAPAPDAAPEPTSPNADSLASQIESIALEPANANASLAIGTASLAAAPEPENSLLTTELNAREAIEKGLMAFNQLYQTSDFYGKAVAGIESAIRGAQPTMAFVNLTAPAAAAPAPAESLSGDVIVSYCNPSIGALSDFTPHHNLYISTHLPADVPTMTIMSPIFDALNALRKSVQPEDGAFELKVILTSFHYTGPRISLRLHIGPVFNIPVFTVHIMNQVLNNPNLPGALAPIEPDPFIYNAKQIGPYNRLDLMLELLLHSDTTHDDPYSPVNVLIARGINVSCVKKFTTGASVSGPEPSPSPNAVIRTECDAFFELLILPEIQSALTKSVLIAVMQNPTVLTSDGKQFSDIFPSGQYGNYFDEVAYKTKKDEVGGAVMLDDGIPLTRTDMIVAALTAANEAMRSSGVHIVAGGGAAVSYYIRDFLGNAFSPEIVAASGVDLAKVNERCGKIMMNDIDCFVFGNVSRQFLLMFSLYMMIVYENFYERAKRYRVKDAIAEQGTRIQFNLSSDDHIGLFMYGNRNDDANTQLISKRLAKNPKVQLVTQETKCFSQIEHPLCGPIGDTCKVDGYYLQPVDLVKKEIEEFVDLYVGSLYPVQDGVQRPADLEAMLLRQYTTDNMVSLKTTMLDVICIFCDEGKSLFIRIFMARKNPKDFARLRVFIDIYLLQLLQADPAFANTEFIQLVSQLRDKMDELNEKYYLEQGNIAATNAATAEQVDKDRTDFLKVLRVVGRKIVELPDPFGDVVPTKFQAATGANTIRVFKENPQMTYNFDMSQHMTQLFSIYTQEQAKQAQVQSADERYTRWLNVVFAQIKFPPESETFFRSKLEQILNPVDPDGNRKIGFKDMSVISPLMLRLHDALKRVKVSKPLILRFRPMFNALVQPIKKQIRQGANPTAYYVGVRNKTSNKTQDGVYDAETKRRLFPTFVKDVILKDEMKDGMKKPMISELIRDLNDNAHAKYDDVVMEEIGRILLDYEPNIAKLSGGGGGGGSGDKTRKRSRRMVRRHPKTRNCKPKSSDKKTRHRRRCTNMHKNKQTRKCIDVYGWDAST